MRWSELFLNLRRWWMELFLAMHTFPAFWRDIVLFCSTYVTFTAFLRQLLSWLGDFLRQSLCWLADFLRQLLCWLADWMSLLNLRFQRLSLYSAHWQLSLLVIFLFVFFFLWRRSLNFRCLECWDVACIPWWRVLWSQLCFFHFATALHHLPWWREWKSLNFYFTLTVSNRLLCMLIERLQIYMDILLYHTENPLEQLFLLKFNPQEILSVLFGTVDFLL